MKLGQPKKIFIVDDDEMLTEALSDFLTRNVNHDISVFHTGEDLLKHIFEKPDVIILDYYLNSVNKDAANGLEILETIHKQHLDNTRVIMLSSQDSYVTATQTIQKGAMEYIIKDEDAFQKIADSL